MQSKSILANQPEPSTHTVPPSTACSEQWWQAAGYGPFSFSDVGGSASKEPLLDGPPVMEGSKDDQSPSNGVDDDDDKTSKDSDTTGSTSAHQDGSSGQGLQKSQDADSSLSLGSGECFSQQPQLELVGHSVACASTPYPDMYYGGMMAAYGPQALVPASPYYGMHQPRMPLPLEMAPEPVFVNAKQYHGILRRRQVRAKAEMERKLIKVRKPYLHESRHQHALRRARGSGGRFAKKGKDEASNHSGDEGNKVSAAGGSQSHKAKEETSNGYNRGIHAGEGQSNQQWGGMSSDHAPQCALAI